MRHAAKRPFARLRAFFGLGAGFRLAAGLGLAVILAAAPALAEGGAAAPQPAAADPVNATAARIAGDGQRTRFVTDLSAPVPITVFTLSDPYRVIIDLPEVHFAVPDGTGASGRGLVSAFRYGTISKGKSRIVLDLTKPVAIDKAFVAAAADGQPPRIVVDVQPSTREAFLEAERKYRDEQQAVTPLRKSDAAPAKPKDGKIRIVLDPGHGGIDNGTKGQGGALEKDVVLAFAKLLAEKLNASGKYEALLTRSDDTFLRLTERVEFARRHQADLFISIHADSFRRDRAVRGAAVYTLSEKASDAMVAEIADHENKSDSFAGADGVPADNTVVDILLDLTLRETKNFSIVFARDVVQELKGDVALSRIPHQQAGFLVLKAPDIPSALIELGFLSNREDEKLLTEAAWREKTAKSIHRAIDTYFGSIVSRRAGR